MSLNATRAVWSLKFPARVEAGGDRAKGSSLKFVLLCLADHANDHDLTWPSATTIARETGLDRKTVLACLPILRAVRIIKRTGVEKRRTPVYKLLLAERDSSTVFSISGPVNGTANGPENGTQNLPSNLSVTDRRAAVGGAGATRPAEKQRRSALIELRKMGILKNG